MFPPLPTLLLLLLLLLLRLHRLPCSSLFFCCCSAGNGSSRLVSSPLLEQFAALSELQVLKGVCTWATSLQPVLDMGLERNQWPAAVVTVIEQFTKLYKRRDYPGYQSTWEKPFKGVAPPLCMPFLVVAGGEEQPKGERPEKMGGWKNATSAACEICTVEGATHMSLLARDPKQGATAIDLIVGKLKATSDGWKK